METNEQNNRAENSSEVNKHPVDNHAAPAEGGEVSEERIAAQARRAERPEPDAKQAAKKDYPADGASGDIVNNTGDDADTPEADAATG